MTGVSSAFTRWTLPTNTYKLQGMSSNADRLAAAVIARRQELDRTQLDVWQSGGPSNTTQTKIENAELETLTRTTARKIDTGLAWAPGSATAVWNGDEPTPLVSLEKNPSATVGGNGDDADSLLYRRPDGLSDAEWGRLKNETREYLEWQINRAARER